MTKTSNKDARQYVQKREEFTGSNTFGRWVDDDNYVVYSWGTHFPMFAYKKNFGWCTQTSKYVYKDDDGNDVISRSTSKHYTQLHPLPDPDIVVVAGVPELQDFTRASVEQLLSSPSRKFNVPCDYLLNPVVEEPMKRKEMCNG